MRTSISLTIALAVATLIAASSCCGPHLSKRVGPLPGIKFADPSPAAPPVEPAK